MCEYSVHTYLPQIQNGFITTPEGHRVGIGGTAVIKDGKVSSFQKITSLNIRLAREETKLPEILKQDVFGDGLCSVLIAGAPSSGKTTLLRALSLWLAKYYRVTVVDERGELFPEGLERGEKTDVLTGCPKSPGIDMVLRTMGPDCIAVDEITAEADLRAAMQAAGCGVGLLATIHAADAAELTQRPLYRQLLAEKVFRLAVRIRRDEAGRTYEVEELPW